MLKDVSVLKVHLEERGGSRKSCKEHTGVFCVEVFSASDV